MNYVGTDLKVVGTRPVRPDGVDKVTGRAQFGADMVMPGMLWGKVKRSPHAHARIVSIDASKALKLPGVHAVVTADDFPDIPSEEAFVGEGPMNFRDLSRNCMARGKALYEGHAVAAVAAIVAGDLRRGARADRREVRGAALRHRRRGGDGGRCAGAARRPVHRECRAEADQAVEHRQAGLLQQGRRRGRLQGGRGDRRGPLHHRAGAPGLYRAACLPVLVRRRRPVHGLQLQPGPLHGARPTWRSCWASTSPTSAPRRPRSAAGSAARRWSIWSRWRSRCRRSPAGR